MTGGTTFGGRSGDGDWHTFEERRFVLSAALSKEERLCYEHEYGIADIGELRVRKPRALMSYVLQGLSERQCWRRNLPLLVDLLCAHTPTHDANGSEAGLMPPKPPWSIMEPFRH